MDSILYKPIPPYRVLETKEKQEKFEQELLSVIKKYGATLTQVKSTFHELILKIEENNKITL